MVELNNYYLKCKCICLKLPFIAWIIMMLSFRETLLYVESKETTACLSTDTSPNEYLLDLKLPYVIRTCLKYNSSPAWLASLLGGTAIFPDRA